jgi:hypothetical protein
MSDMTQREGLAAQERAAGAAASAAAGANSEALELQRRGLDLEAISMLQGMDKFGLGALGDLGGTLDSSQRFAAGELTPTLEGLRGDRLDRAMGGSAYLDEQRNRAAELANQRRRNAALAPGRDLDDYLRRLSGMSGDYGTTSSHRTTTDPGRGAGFLVGLRDPTAAAIDTGSRIMGEDAAMFADTAGGVMGLFS